MSILISLVAIKRMVINMSIFGKHVFFFVQSIVMSIFFVHSIVMLSKRNIRIDLYCFFSLFLNEAPDNQVESKRNKKKKLGKIKSIKKEKMKMSECH